jgi:hypothetical protein
MSGKRAGSIGEGGFRRAAIAWRARPAATKPRIFPELSVSPGRSLSGLQVRLRKLP